ncbi:hypothetical protein [Enterococcus rotai]|uniref:hypothetical protein n=1 Tax=Enterococcus rotai TaxID=118060 RepID=UPI0035C7179B
MKQVVIKWASRSIIIIFLVMVILGVIQVLIQRSLVVVFDPSLFSMVFGIVFINIWFSEKENRRFNWGIMLIITFLLMYLPQKVFSLLSIDQLYFSIPMFLIVLVVLVASYYGTKKVESRI